MNESSEKHLENFCFELTTTQACNFSCDYCFENDCESPSDNNISNRIKDVLLKMRELFDCDWFKKLYGSKRITFWGGEPSLNMKVIKAATQEFKDDIDVSFFIFTNGSMIEELLPILLEFKGRFDIQLSYDGEPVNYRRKTKKGTYSSSIVWHAMDVLRLNEIPFQIKSTICYDDFKYLPEVWEHFKLIRATYGKQIRYAVTVDYHNIEFEKYFDEVEDSLLKVAKLEMEFYKQNNMFLSNIFTGQKKHCECGKRMLTIDVDGKAYYCHGCLYSDDKTDFKFSNVFDKDFSKKVKQNYSSFYDNHPVIEECDNCVALTCLRCNVTKYESSLKDGFHDRWYDYPSQKDLCNYYIMVGKIGRAMLNLLKEE